MLTGETEGQALVLDTALPKARRWSRFESFPGYMYSNEVRLCIYFQVLRLDRRAKYIHIMPSMYLFNSMGGVKYIHIPTRVTTCLYVRPALMWILML